MENLSTVEIETDCVTNAGSSNRLENFSDVSSAISEATPHVSLVVQ
jgi:hypothetical protein